VITTIFLIVNIVTHVFTSHDMTIIPALVGGGLTGFFYMQQWKQGKDWGAGFNKLLFRITHLFHPKEQVKLRVIK
jgi:hypothetical protein